MIPKKKTKLKERAESLGVNYLPEVPKGKINSKILDIIPEDVAKGHKMVVFDKEGNTIKVAMLDVQDIESLNILQFIAEKDKLSTEIYLTSEYVLDKMLNQYGGTTKALEAVLKSFEDEKIADIEDLEKKEEKSDLGILQNAPVAKLVQVIFRHAIDGRASDIHVEPIGDDYRVRFRVDGLLYASLSLPSGVGKAVIARIKILANLKIDEKRKPQDGRFRIKEDKQGIDHIDFRVSTLPVVEGEKVVMRILIKDKKLFDIKALGLVGTNYDILSKSLRMPHGIILLTGPTGSGKSTTLYAFLNILNEDERNIITLEDPVEYFINGINQSQIKPEIGYTFASGLRSILRQDPNIIMVGEIRDKETAELAIHAALTGHLVFSTLHTNDSVGAVPRLVDMGIEPFLISSALKLIGAQRLVRRICENCKEEIEFPENVVNNVLKEVRALSEAELKKYNINLSKKPQFYKGRGCEECAGQGLKGRIAIYEAFDVNEEMQRVITESGGDETNIISLLKQRKMITLKQDGLIKVLQGITVLSEVELVTESSLNIGGDTTDTEG